MNYMYALFKVYFMFVLFQYIQVLSFCFSKLQYIYRLVET